MKVKNTPELIAKNISLTFKIDPNSESQNFIGRVDTTKKPVVFTPFVKYSRGLVIGIPYDIKKLFVSDKLYTLKGDIVKFDGKAFGIFFPNNYSFLKDIAGYLTDITVKSQSVDDIDDIKW